MEKMEGVGFDMSRSKQSDLRDYTDFTYHAMPLAERRKLDVGDIFMNQVKCKLCGWIIRSRNRHNYVTCKCGGTFVDGGSWYQSSNANGEDVSVMYKHKPKKYHQE